MLADRRCGDRDLREGRITLLTGATKRIDIPHEPGEWVEIRMLSWRQVESIRQAAADDEEMVGLTFETGIVAWSYDEPVSVETIGRIDSVTAAWIATILTTGQGTEADRKNGSASSTSPSKARVTTRTNGS